ncbi:MAG: hypothetical protein IKQ41_12065 [Clostridia bacterium]|nr:hypothetical protein [Clostridia bacterium]
MNFQISLAGRIVEIHSLFDKIRQNCEGYLLAEPERKEADILIEIIEEDLEREQAAVRQENKKTGMNARYAPEDLEVTAAYRKIGARMPAFDTFVMHGSVISTSGKGYMITAPSGIGKTTRSRIWTECIPESFIVNGDKPLLRVTQDSVYAYGTPWCGKEGWNANTGVPLKAIFLLERSEAGNRIIEMNLADAFPQLLHQTFRPDDPDANRKTLRLLQAMAGKIKVFRFCSEPTAEAVRLAWEKAGG